MIPCWEAVRERARAMCTHYLGSLDYVVNCAALGTVIKQACPCTYFEEDTRNWVEEKEGEDVPEDWQAHSSYR